MGDRVSEPRGREASGLVLAVAGEASVFKRGEAPSKMLASPEYAAFLAGALSRITSGPGGLAEPMAAIGHCRLVTNGVETVSGNNQPIIAGHTIGIHNGIIANDAALWQAYGDIKRDHHTDSEILFRLIERHAGAGSSIAEAVSKTFAEIEGAASIAFLRDDLEALTLATNTGSLYTAEMGGSGFFAFASERYIVAEFLKSNPLGADLSGVAARRLTPGRGCIAAFADAGAAFFDLGQQPQPPAPGIKPDPVLAIVDRSERTGEIRRCVKCVLPASYPFIEFDEHGVCNKCREYVSQRPIGRDALETELAKHRSKDGSPDCIVAFSGGRDSSYGLHLIKNELGMNPVAFTYDWGMVTDIARRNQARMCGRLGVEHILRAADIPSKRRYIRKNIQAWLKRPHLGMIPLFMAGDKYFYHYARELKKELGIELVIFCAGNELERTDFKSGFAGVRETSGHRNRLFGFSLMNKIGLATFYAGQYLRNPAYINESLIDSLGAFFQTFVAKDDFLYLFDYLKWDEGEINKTLIGTYGWETAEHSDNTWRIGDGYTAFINYIYQTVAGFSEYHTFRSNQIREGLIGRDEALRLLRTDTEPPLDVLYDFAKHTGFNLEEVLSRINSIGKLY